MSHGAKWLGNGSLLLLPLEDQNQARGRLRPYVSSAIV
jgi:hypothetical protein